MSLLKLPPPRLPPTEVQQAPDTATDAVKQERPKVTRPVPILVDTPTADPVPPDTQVKQYEMGDELLPGDPGPPMPAGAVDGDPTTSAPVEQTPVYWKMKLLDMKPPVYPPRCLRLGVEGTVRLRVLVGEDGRPQDAAVRSSSGDAGPRPGGARCGAQLAIRTGEARRRATARLVHRPHHVPGS